jgi:hypothetical protein
MVSELDPSRDVFIDAKGGLNLPSHFVWLREQLMLYLSIIKK